jgi:hypothetical protein
MHAPSILGSACYSRVVVLICLSDSRSACHCCRSTSRVLQECRVVSLHITRAVSCARLLPTKRINPWVFVLPQWLLSHWVERCAQPLHRSWCWQAVPSVSVLLLIVVSPSYLHCVCCACAFLVAAVCCGQHLCRCWWWGAVQQG